MNHRTRRLAWIRSWHVAVTALLVLMPLIAWGWVRPGIDPTQCSLARNALWVSVDWTSQPADATDVRELAAASAARSVVYILPFTTYLEADGTFSPSYAHAAEFVSEFRRADPNIRLLAWIGVPLPSRSNLGVHGHVNLAAGTLAPASPPSPPSSSGSTGLTGYIWMWKPSGTMILTSYCFLKRCGQP